MAKARRDIFPAEQRPEKVREIKSYVKEGMTVDKACEKGGISLTQYYAWRPTTKVKTRRKKSVMHLHDLSSTIAASTTQQHRGGNITITRITCDVSDLQNTLAALNS